MPFNRKLFFTGVSVGVALVVSVAVAFIITQIQGTVEVSEGITVSPTSFNVSLFPGETFTQTIEITNAGSVAIDVDIDSSVSGPSPTNKLIVSHPGIVSAIGNSTTDINVQVEAKPDITPGTYTIDIEIGR